MSRLLSELIGPTGSMAYLKRGVKARQVTTHTHDAMPMEALNPFKKIGHSPKQHVGISGDERPRMRYRALDHGSGPVARGDFSISDSRAQILMD